MSVTDSILVGITGGIGTGQTTVAKQFEKFGAKIINADQVGHFLLNSDDEVRKAVLQVFGKKVFDRSKKIDRQKLGMIVFGDERQLQRLNRIMHPIMVTHIIEEIENARNNKKYKMVVLDAALIFEIQMEQLFDAVVVVSSKNGLRLERVMARDKVDEIEVKNRINRQIPIKDKVKWADYVIHNNGDLEQLESKSQKVYKQILNKFLPKAPPKARPGRRPPGKKIEKK